MSTIIATQTLPEVDFAVGSQIGDEILLSAVAGQKIATVKAPLSGPGVNRAWSMGGSVD